MNAEFAKQALLHNFSQNFTKFFQIFYVFIAISAHNSAQNFIKLNSDRAKEFTLRMSADKILSDEIVSDKIVSDDIVYNEIV